MSKKSSDQGWFYHAPPKPENKERVFAPPPSQIPGLSDVSQLPPDPVSGHFYMRESDSKYVRLAKQGGRPDLLVMHTPEPLSSQPVGYPRCEWYYDQVASNSKPCDDNAEPYQFMLPDYMVHVNRKPKCTDADCGEPAAGRTPYAHDTQTAYDRDGCQATDKTVKLAEERPSGYGVRNERQQQKQAKRANVVNCGEPATPASQCRPPANVNRTRQLEDEQVKMKKLLSFSYAGEYEKQKSDWREREAAKNIANEQQQQQTRPTTKSSASRPSNARKTSTLNRT